MTKQNAIALLQDAGELRRCTITSYYPTKNDIYQTKAEIADKALNGNADAQVLLTIEAEGRGLTWEQLAAVIVAKRASWLQAAFTIARLEAQGTAAVQAATDETAIDVVQPYIDQIHAIRA